MCQHAETSSPAGVWFIFAGVPTALRFMPGLLDAVKAAVGREANQLFDKLAFVASKVGSVLLSGGWVCTHGLRNGGYSRFHTVCCCLLLSAACATLMHV